MDGSTNVRRRRTLHMVGTGVLGGLAGCTDNEEGNEGGETDDTPLENGEESSTTDWPFYRADPANTGHQPEVSGPDDPEIAWETDTGGTIYASPTVFEGSIYIGNYADTVSSLDAESGEENWTVDVGGNVFSSVAVAGSFAYVGGFDDAVYALSLDDGSEAERFETDGDVGSSPAIVDGTLYVGCDDGTVYALGGKRVAGRDRWGGRC